MKIKAFLPAFEFFSIWRFVAAFSITFQIGQLVIEATDMKLINIIIIVPFRFIFYCQLNKLHSKCFNGFLVLFWMLDKRTYALHFSFSHSFNKNISTILFKIKWKRIKQNRTKNKNLLNTIKICLLNIIIITTRWLR